MSEVTITSENFDAEVLNSDKPVLIDFWATWCGPCQMLSPIVAEIAEEYADQVKVGKVNVDEQMDLAMKYGVEAIPMVFCFKGGKISGTKIGYVPKEELVSLFR